MKPHAWRAGMGRAFGLLLVAGSLVVPARGAPEGGAGDPGASSPPLEALRQVVRQAWSGPSLRAVRAEFEAEEAAARVLGNPGSPHALLELEGIEGSFDRAPNAGNYLRFGLPFNGPGQSKRSRSLLEGTRLFGVSSARVAALAVGARAAADWLELAATIDSLAVRRGQLARLERAVILQRKRFELGELAGGELVPLELERARQVSLAQELEAGRAALAASIEELTGGPFPLPAEGDLARLRAELGPFAWDEEALEARLAASPYAERSAHEIETTRLAGEQEKATIRGRPTVVVSWENFPTLEGLEGYDSLGLALSVPLPVGKLEKHRQAETEARVRQGEAEAEVLLRGLRAQVLRWAGLAEAAVRSLAATESLEAGLPRSSRSLDEQFRLGAIDYLVYLDGFARLDEIRIRTIRARYAELHARIELAALLPSPDLFPLPDPAQETLP